MSQDHFPFWMPIEVRWADMDSLGHVNNAVYFTYIESARLAYFHAIGLGRYWNRQCGPILARITCDFREPIVHPAKLQAGIRAGKIGNSSFGIEAVLTLDGRDRVVASSDSVIVWYDYEAGKPSPLTDDMRALLKPSEQP